MSDQIEHAGPSIRVAMVGSGGRAGAQVESMRRSGRAVPVGFWNRTQAVADARSREAGLDRGFATITEMIQATVPDVVSVVTHPTARLALLRETIAAGARVILLEKPIALTPAELREIEAMTSDVFVAVNTQYRWMTHWERFWQTLRDGRIGEIRNIRASTGVDILEQGPHLLSLALTAARAAGLPMPTWVLAGGSGDSHYGEIRVPSDLTAVMDLGPARLQVLAGGAAPLSAEEDLIYFQQQVEIIGSRGRLWASLTRGWEMWAEDEVSSGITQWPRDDHQAQAALFADLADAVHTPSLRAQFPTSITRAAEETSLLFACIESARSQRTVHRDSWSM
ncbi:Gfo/Idh/MocA family protein [Microbacterium phyllosphaerae]|uniref:Gfo/Idh/MocA family protein n=1 Tax=Microbacterium phyllosphaerae TaxID=124798 RepID=UPI003D655E0C